MRIKLLPLLFILVVLAAPATSISKTFNSTYHWNNALDHSGVTWDGIQDHADQPTLQQGYTYGSLTEGLIGYWNFEEKRPKGPVDRALGNNGTFKGDNDGTLNNFEFNAESGWTGDSKRGSHALQFDGKDDIVRVDHSSELEFSSTTSISFWIKPDNHRKGVVMLKFNCGVGGWRVLRRTDSFEFSYVDSGSDQHINSAIDTPADKWTLVTIVKDDGTLYGYRNGKRVDTDSIVANMDQASQDLTIGEADPGCGQDHYFDGSIDNIQIYDNALSSGEVENLYRGNPIKRSGIVGEWTFDTGSGTTAYDTSNWGNGKLGDYSGKFDGSDDYVDLGDVHSSPTALTISGWVNLDDTSDEVVLNKGIGAIGEREYSLQIVDSKVRGIVADESAEDIDSLDGGTDVSQNSWAHVVMTWDGKKMRVFKDGSLDGVLSTSVNAGDIEDLGDPLRIGRDQNSQSNGNIDSVRLYDRALSSQEVKSLYKRNRLEQRIGPQDTLQSGLVGWWPLHEKNSGEATDLSANHQNGILGNLSLGDDSEPDQGIAGRAGLTAYSFDGNDYINISNAQKLVPDSNKITAAAWVKPKEKGNNYIITKSAGNVAYHLSLEGGNDYRWHLEKGTGNDILNLQTGDWNKHIGEWLFVLGTYNGTVAKLYGNGKLIGTKKGTGSFDTTAGPLCIGANNCKNRFFKGNIGNIRIYNRAISKSEIQRLYKMGDGNYATPPGGENGGVAYWSFDQSDNTRVVEDEWNNNDGVLGIEGGTDQPKYTENAIRSEALQFDGSDDWVETGFTGEPKSITFSAWFNPSTFSDNDGIITRLDGSGDDEGCFLGRDNSKLEFTCQMNPSGSDDWRSVSASDPPLGEWTHAVGYYDHKNENLALYVNGELRDKSFAPSPLHPTQNAPIAIGRFEYNDPNRGLFDGTIDEVRVYKRSLNSYEIHDLYQHGTGGRDMRSLTTNKGLVGYWSLDENSGQKAYDLSGQGNHGNLGSDQSIQSSDPSQGSNGVLGTSAYSFDGSDDKVNLGNGTSLEASSFTLSVWVNANEDLTNVDQSFISRWSGNNYNYLLRSGQGGGGKKVEGRIHDGGGSGSAVSLYAPNPSPNKWSHYVLTNNENGERRLYKNGKLYDSRNGVVTGGTEKTLLGARNGQTYFNGAIDEVRIYNRSLTISEVQKLYSTSQTGEILTEWSTGGPVKPQITETDWSQPEAPSTSELVGAWRLNEDYGFSSSGDTVKDWSGNANEGTTNGGITTQVEGAFNGSQAYEFDGSDDRIDISDPEVLDEANSITVSGWINLDNFNSKYPTMVHRDKHFVQRVDKDDTLEFYFYEGDTFSDNSVNGPVPTTDKWIHYTGVYDKSSGNAKIYVNGQFKDADNIGSRDWSGSSDNLDIGTDSSLSDAYFDGTLDDLRIYSDALSQKEITSLYHTDSISTTVVGNQKSQDVEYESQGTPYPDGWSGGPKTYDLDWKQPHDTIRTDIELDTSNVTESSSVSSIGLNASSYDTGNQRNWRSGFSNGVNVYGKSEEISLEASSLNDSSLEGYWNFEPKNPGKVTDVSGENNDGMLYGSEKDGTLQNFDFDASDGWISGRQNGHALKFDGGEVDLGDRSDFDLYAPFALSLWIKPENTSRGTQILVDKEPGGLGGAWKGYALRLSQDDILTNWGNGNSQDYLNANGVVSEDEWTHVVWRKNASYNSIYIDGTQVAEKSDNVENLSNSDTLELGRHSCAGCSNPYFGKMDDVRIFDGDLSPKAIKNIYIGESDPRSGLVGEWAFDEGSGTVAHDTSKWTEGVRQGKALEFDGSDDYVNTNINAEKENLNEITVSTWIKSSSYSRFLGAYDGCGEIRLGRDSRDWYFLVHDSSCNQRTISSDTSSNEWTHVTGTYDGKSIAIYVNGDLVDQSQFNVEFPNEELFLGAYNGDGSSGSYLDGKIDETRVYSRALTYEEISKLYNPSLGYWSSQFFNGDKSTTFTNLTWAEAKEGSTSVEGRAQVAERVHLTEDEEEWNSGTSSIAANNGVLGYWRFEDPSVGGDGGKLVDWSGNGNTATTKNGVATNGEGFRPQSNSIRLDGKDDFVEATEAPFDFNVSDSFSVSFWMKPDKKSSGGLVYKGLGSSPYTNWGIIQRGSGGPGPYNIMFLMVNDWDSNGIKKDGVTNLNDQKWHRVTVTYNGSGKASGAKIFVDGKEESYQVERDDLNASTLTDKPLRFGVRYDYQHWGGNLDEIRVYNRELSENEIESSYSSMTWTSKWIKWSESHYEGTEPMSRWEFSRGAGQTVRDLEGSNDGTLGGSTSYESSDPKWEQDCRTDGCMNFDGSGERVEVKDFSGPTDSFTGSYWVKTTQSSGNDAMIGYSGTNDIIFYKPSSLTFFVDGNSHDFGINIADGNWHHLAWRWRSSDGNATIFVDGEQEGTSTLSQGANLPSTSCLVFGHEQDSDCGGYQNSQAFDGQLDDIRIYNNYLTKSEIQNTISNPKQPFASWQNQGGQDLKPAAQWKFDEGVGQKAHDSIGDSDGTLGGSTTSQSSDPNREEDCRYKSCMEFDGNGDYIALDKKYEGTGVIEETTVCAWVRSSSSQQQIIGSFDRSEYWRLALDDDQSPYIGWDTMDSSGTQDDLGTSNSYTDGRWHHVCGWFNTDSNPDKKIFVDGDLKASRTAHGGNALGEGQSGEQPRYGFIGVGSEATSFDGSKGPKDWMNGYIDDFRIYNRSLTDQEIKVLYNSPSSSWSSTSVQIRTSAADPEEEELVGSWSFEGVGQTVVDSSKENNNGYLGDTLSDENIDPTRVNGYSGQGLDFDGQNDYISLDGDSSLTVNNLTLSVWAKFEEIPDVGVENHQIINTGSYNLAYRDGSRIQYQLIPTTGSNNREQVRVGVQKEDWVHIVGTFDNSNGDLRLYFDGNQVASATLNEELASVDNTIFIGGNPGGDRVINATLDELQIYNDVLSEKEIQDLNKMSDFTSASKFNQGSFFETDNPKLETVDSFEDGDIGEYSGETGSFTVSSSSPVWKGTQSLKSTTNNREIVSNSGLSDYPERGDTFEYWIHGGGDTNSGGGLIFGRADSNNYIKASIMPGNDAFRIWKNDAGSGVEVASKSLTLADNRWYRGEIEWKEDGSIIFSVYDSTKTEMAEIETSPQKYTKGGVGWTTADSNGAPDLTFDNFKIKKEEFESQYLQYKVNMLTGDSSSVPSVEKVSVAQASGWTGFSSNSNSTNLGSLPGRFGQLQLKLSSDNPESSPAVDGASLHTEPEGTDWLCSAPETGDWIIDRNCTFTGEQDAPGNIKVPNPHEVNITSDGLLGINLRKFHLLIESKAKVLIDKLGSVQRVSFPEDCQEVLEENPSASSGSYKIDPDGEGGVDAFSVYCEMSENGGGWIKLKTENDQPYTTGSWGYFDAPYDEPNYSIYDHISSPIEQSQYSRSCPGETTVDVQYKNPQTGKFYSKNQIEGIQHLLSSISSNTRQVVFSGDDDGDNLQHEVYINGFHMTPFTSGNEEWDYGIYSDESDTTSGFDLENGESLSPLPEEGENILPNEVRFYCDDGNSAGGANSWGYEKDYVLVK